MPAAHTRLIGLLVGATFVVILNETIMSVAIPHLVDDLDIAVTTAQWLTTGFLLTMAVVIPVTGFLLQRFHVRQIYIAAMTAFSLGTAIAASAPGFEVLLVGRIVQATGTALMMPLLMTTVMSLVPEDRRGQMMGTITIVIAVAPAIGPTISGLILEGMEWRWLFIFVLPIALLALGVGAKWVQNVTEPRELPLDYVSVVLSAIAFAGVVYGLSAIGESARGDTPVAPAIPIVIGVLFLGLFVWRQFALKDLPLMDLRVFGNRTFSFSIGMIGLSFAGLFGAIILIPIWMQGVKDASTLTTGLVLLPGGLVMGLSSPIVGRFFDKAGPRPLVIPSTAIVAVSLFLLSRLDEGSSTGLVVGIYAFLCVGLAMLFTPLLTTALGGLPPQLYSHGSAIITTLQQVAGAAGTAVFITILTRRETTVLDDGGSDALAIAEGFQDALLAGAVFGALAFVFSFFIRPAPKQAMPHGMPGPDAGGEAQAEQQPALTH